MNSANKQFFFKKVKIKFFFESQMSKAFHEYFSYTGTWHIPKLLPQAYKFYKITHNQLIIFYLDFFSLASAFSIGKAVSTCARPPQYAEARQAHKNPGQTK